MNKPEPLVTLPDGTKMHLSQIQAEAIREHYEELCAGVDGVAQLFQRTALIAHCIGALRCCKNQREFAYMMGMSEPHVSRLVKVLRPKITMKYGVCDDPR